MAQRETHDRAGDVPRATRAEIAARAAEQRRVAAQRRSQAAERRVAAGHDRRSAARERERAARGRRALGTAVVAHVQIRGPDGSRVRRALNGNAAQDAGEEPIARAVARVSARLRTYDVVVRLSADELVCTLFDVTVSDARRRFGEVAEELAASPDPIAITTAVAPLTFDEVAAKPAAREDGEHPRARVDDE